jgi:hypothetical protein
MLAFHKGVQSLANQGKNQYQYQQYTNHEGGIKRQPLQIQHLQQVCLLIKVASAILATST